MVRFTVTKGGRELCALIGLVRPLPWATIKETIKYNCVLVHVRDDSRDLSVYAHDARLLRNTTMSSVRSDGCDVHCCAYSLSRGGYLSTNWDDKYIARRDGPGMEDMQESGEIALLLDYDTGRLTLYKNNHLLGVVQDGLAGEYSWMVSLGCIASIDIVRSI